MDSSRDGSAPGHSPKSVKKTNWKKFSTENLTRVKILSPSGARMVYRAGLIFAAAAGHHLSKRGVSVYS